MRCKTCHYSLENLTEDRCPECGREFDPNDLDGIEPQDTRGVLRPLRHFRMIRGFIAALLLVCLPFLVVLPNPTTAPWIDAIPVDTASFLVFITIWATSILIGFCLW